MASQVIAANPARGSKRAYTHYSRAFFWLLWVGLLFGGAGERYVLIELILAIAAASLLLVTACGGRLQIGPSAKRLLAIAAVWCGLGLLYSLPMPPLVWQYVARGSAAEPVLASLAHTGAWRVMGLDPDRTMLFLLSCPLPLAGFWMTYSASAESISSVFRVLLCVALFSALLACLQLGSGGQPSLYMFATGHQGSGTGLYINRNHVALLMLVAMPFLASSQSVPGRWRGQDGGKSLRAAAALLLILGILATVSRTAVVLLLLMLVGAALLFRIKGTFRSVWLKVFPALAIAGFVVSQMPVATTIFNRFAILTSDFRYLYWDNTIYLLSHHFPVGAGPGAFARLYTSIEPLTQVRPEFVGHAHNDWLEITLEFGLLGVACLVALLVVLCITAKQAVVRASLEHRPLFIATGIGLLLISAFSAVDYPLRMPALAFVSSILAGVLARGADGEQAVVALKPLAGCWRFVAIAVAVGTCFVLLCSVLSRQLLRGGLPDAAVAVAPWSGAAHAGLAQALASESRWTEARHQAVTALWRQPLDPQAARVLAASYLAAGDSAKGGNWLALAASLGWRDPLTQEWVAMESLRAGQPEVAAERFDALLRQGRDDPKYYTGLSQLVAMPGGIAAIANRLEETPGWYRGFFNALAAYPPSTPHILELLSELRKRGVAASNQDTELLRWTLWERRQFADVARIWHSAGAGPLLGDSRFSDLDGELPATAAPYSWSSPRQTGISVVGIDDGNGQGGHKLQVLSDGNVAGPVLAQSILLEPGFYKAVLRISGISDLSLRLTLTCYQAGLERWSDTSYTLADSNIAPSASSFSGDFTVGNDCPAQVLKLVVIDPRGREGHVLIEQATIEQVGIDRVDANRALKLP